MKTIKFVIEEVFKYEDDIDGDYAGINVKLDDELLAEYGDHYHDKGWEKAIGFIKGYMSCINHNTENIRPYTIKEISVVDPDIY